MEIVKITWIDAQRLECNIQYDKEIEDIDPIPCCIVGFKIFEDHRKIIIAQERWDDLGGNKYLHVIPKVSIIGIVELIESKKEEQDNERNTKDKAAGAAKTQP